jgi:hypothetical protein
MMGLFLVVKAMSCEHDFVSELVKMVRGRERMVTGWIKGGKARLG